MESQPQNPEFRNIPEIVHQCDKYVSILSIQLPLDKLKINQRSYYNLHNSVV